MQQVVCGKPLDNFSDEDQAEAKVFAKEYLYNACKERGLKNKMISPFAPALFEKAYALAEIKFPPPAREGSMDRVMVMPDTYGADPDDVREELLKKEAAKILGQAFKAEMKSQKSEGSQAIFSLGSLGVILAVADRLDAQLGVSEAKGRGRLH